jgi:hypothetical protein
MSAGAWRRFCIVGIGGHARTKLLPALLANGQDIVGLVSSQPAEALPCGPIFRHLSDALRAIPADAVIVIATPPALHFEQARLAVEAGHDVVVEKPAFVREAQAREIADACEARATVLVEGLMHRYTGLYARLLQYWRAHRSRVAGLDLIFSIPAMLPGTFRQDGSIESSCLYDMGCYVVSLLADLDLTLEGLELGEVAQSRRGETIVIGGTLDGVAASACFGVDDEYRNLVELRMSDGRRARFQPFFYGRPGNRHISIEGGGAVDEQVFSDPDAFRTMFGMSRATWLDSQPARMARLIDVTRLLESLGEALVQRRGAAP